MKKVSTAKAKVESTDITRNELRDILADFILWYAVRYGSVTDGKRQMALGDAEMYLSDAGLLRIGRLHYLHSTQIIKRTPQFKSNSH